MSNSPLVTQNHCAQNATFGGREMGSPIVKSVVVGESSAEAAKSGKERYDIVQSVVDFVNLCTGSYNYSRSEIPLKALQAYHADFYLAQVNNGGHSQFIHNSRPAAETTFSDALAGLQAMGAPQLNILEEMMKWSRANPEVSETEIGFSVRSPFLNKLDDRFDAQEKIKSIVDYSAEWILSWPELRIVPDSTYMDEMRKIRDANQKYDDRQLLKNVQGLDFECTYELRVALGLLLNTLKERESLIHLGGGGSYEIEGQYEKLFYVKTDHGEREIMFGKNEIRLYEMREPKEVISEKSVGQKLFEKVFGESKPPVFDGPKVGRRIAAMPTKSVSDVIAAAKANSSGAAIGFLLQQIGQLDSDVTVAAYPTRVEPDNTSSVRWVVTTKKDVLRIETSSGSAEARRFQDEMVLAHCSITEAKDFLERCEKNAELPALD